LKTKDLREWKLQEAFYIGLFMQKKEKLHHISVDVKKDICYTRHVRIRSQIHEMFDFTHVRTRQLFIYSPC